MTVYYAMPLETSGPLWTPPKRDRPVLGPYDSLEDADVALDAYLRGDLEINDQTNDRTP